MAETLTQLAEAILDGTEIVFQMQPSFWRKISPIVTAILATYPLGSVLSLYILGCRLAAQLGHWPSPYEWIPGTPGPNWHLSQVRFGLVTFPFVSVCCVVWIIAARVYWKDYPVWRLLLLTVFSCAAAFLLIKRDPGALLNWYFESGFLF